MAENVMVAVLLKHKKIKDKASLGLLVTDLLSSCAK